MLYQIIFRSSCRSIVKINTFLSNNIFLNYQKKHNIIIKYIITLTILLYLHPTLGYV